MTNVTYLPWVEPENSAVGGSENHTEPPTATGPELELISESEDVAIAALDIDQLEQTLLRKLHTADMSVSEARTWLIKKDAPEGDVQMLIEKCERLGYLDDTRLAQQLVLKLTIRKGKSASAIAQLLRQRGIPGSVITDALSEISEDDQYQQARELAQKRLSSLSSYDRETAQRRLTGFLMRRGYSSSVVRSVCDEVLKR